MSIGDSAFKTALQLHLLPQGLSLSHICLSKNDIIGNYYRIEEFVEEWLTKGLVIAFQPTTFHWQWWSSVFVIKIKVPRRHIKLHQVIWKKGKCGSHIAREVCLKQTASLIPSLCIKATIMNLWLVPGTGLCNSDTTWVGTPVSTQGSCHHLPVQLSLHKHRWSSGHLDCCSACSLVIIMLFAGTSGMA